MVLSGPPEGLSRRWFAAGLCVVAPLILVGAGSIFLPLGPEISSAAADPGPITVSDDTPEPERRELPVGLAAGLTGVVTTPGAGAGAVDRMTEPAPDPIAEAKSLVARGRARYRDILDYTCLFTKRERLKNGRLVGPHVMEMKVRTNPRSIYFRFVKPHKGREAIWVDGQFDGKMVVHDVGLGKLLAGTLKLEPASGMAMEDNRHPISEAGFGFLLEELATRWEIEMLPGEIEVTISRNARVDDRACTLVESKHPRARPGYLYHKVKVYFDHELHLPVRFEAYDWPTAKTGETRLMEEYNYVNLELNNGLDDADFDPANSEYAFGRF